jgi:hypothetical protein
MSTVVGLFCLRRQLGRSPFHCGQVFGLKVSHDSANTHAGSVRCSGPLDEKLSPGAQKETGQLFLDDAVFNGGSHEAVCCVLDLACPFGGIPTTVASSMRIRMACCRFRPLSQSATDKFHRH